jgi:hypothetical protein
MAIFILNKTNRLEPKSQKRVESADKFIREQLYYVQPLQQAVTTQQSEPFRTAFQAAVGGCNDCHKATQHAFITIPQEPPQLSIFVFPPASK